MKTPSYSMWKILLVSLLALVTLPPSYLRMWRLAGTEIQSINIGKVAPGAITTQAVPYATLSEVEYQIELLNKQAIIHPIDSLQAGSGWKSPENWQVRQVFFADLNRDGENEAVLLVWRPFKPWPVDRFVPHGGRINSFQDKGGYSCHLILIGLVNGVFKEIWAGSALSDPFHNLVALDLDGDGYQELAALEYQYDGSMVNSNLVVWRWNGFGFSLVDRKAGNFTSLTGIISRDSILLLTQD